MSIILRRKLIARTNIRRYLSTVTQQDEEYTGAPQYPPILDTAYEKKLERKKQVQYDEIKAVKTIEEKQIKLNMPKYYGFKCYILDENHIPYNNLPLAQHVTRTHLIETKNLPEYYNEFNVDKSAEILKSQLEEAILLELEGYKKSEELNKDLATPDLENLYASTITKQLNRIIMNNMVQDYNHLLDTQVDFDPRIESFWFAGGINPPKNIKRYRTGEGQDWRKHTENDPSDRAIQYNGQPMITLRNEKPLKPILAHSEASNPEFKVPHFKYDPRVVGITTKHQHASNIPGFWPGDKHRFGIVSYHNRGHFTTRHYNDVQDDKEALYRQGILSSFGWLNAQANFLGFTTFNEITYPLVTQTILTNGQNWSFFVYQLNTLLVYGKNATENPCSNICWVLPDQKLYETIQDGKLVGFNDDVLKTILKYYANTPSDRLGANLTPYLSQEEKVVAHYALDDKRNWLEREYKFLVSNRPRHRLEYEIYHWEKIYKIDHNTRYIEARRRPFELFYKPSDKKLNDRAAKYIPRKLRPELPRHKGRYAPEYFP